MKPICNWAGGRVHPGQVASANGRIVKKLCHEKRTTVIAGLLPAYSHTIRRRLKATPSKFTWRSCTQLQGLLLIHSSTLGETLIKHTLQNIIQEIVRDQTKNKKKQEKGPSGFYSFPSLNDKGGRADGELAV